VWGSTGQIDRRKQARFRLIAEVTFFWFDMNGTRLRGQGTTQDVSSEGVLVVSQTAPPVGAALLYEVFLPKLSADSAPMRMKGVGMVVRAAAALDKAGERFAIHAPSSLLTSPQRPAP
jgi:hypothetical protein